MRALLCLGLLSWGFQAFGFSIQGVSGPDCVHANPMIRRYSVHLDKEKDEVHYGTCDSTEVTCLPNSPSYAVKRTMKHDDYQKRLAELFNVDPRYLKNEEKQQKNFESIIQTLRQILTSTDASEEAKQEARQKLMKLTIRGGMVERFNDSCLIKKSLKWEPEHPEAHAAIFEKSRKQFSQALYPFDFVTDLKPRQPNVTFEPSTENTWYYAGAHMTFAEAYRICEKAEGYRMPTKAELEVALKWIPHTVFGAQIKTLGPGDSRKAVWVAERTSEHYKDREEERWVGEYSRRLTKVNVHLWRIIFNYAYVDSGVFSTAVIPTGLENEPAYSNLIDEYGIKTGRMSALCVLNPEKL